MTATERLCGFLVFFVALLLFPSISRSQTSVLPKGCVDCHGSETKYSVRGARTQYLTSGHRTIEKEKSNLCANCHRARRKPADEVRARNIPTESWGPHHGPQADMLLGTNAYEFPGKKYSESVHALLPKADCVTCHMTQPTGWYSLMPTIGGHSFKIEGEVHKRPTLNAAGCLSSGCHAGMKQVQGTLFFDRKAPADYDGNGKIETIQEEVQGLYERLINNQGTGLLQTMKDPLTTPEESSSTTRPNIRSKSSPPFTITSL